MIKQLKLTGPQWKLLAGAFSNISQAIILFSLAAFFVPVTVGLSKTFPHLAAVGFLINGLLILIFAAML